MIGKSILSLYVSNPTETFQHSLAPIYFLVKPYPKLMNFKVGITPKDVLVSSSKMSEVI